MANRDDAVLRSSALGTDLDALIRPCGDHRRPATPPAPASGPSIGLTFSGGGFRATFAALGVVRFLADCGLLGNVRYVSSVSGGSIANAMLATQWPKLRDEGFSASAVQTHVVGPLADRVGQESLKLKLVRNLWRAVGSKTRTDVLAWALDDWLFDGAELEALDPECRWIFNAANLTTGVRFGFERDVLGDYVSGLASTNGTKIRVSTAVAASAAVPGAFPPMTISKVDFPCAGKTPPELVDGGAYDNTGLEALDADSFRDVFTITINAGGQFVTGAYGKVPIVRELARANSLLYRQSTGLRTRWMVDRFQAWERTPAGEQPPRSARQGVLYGLGTSFALDQVPQQFRDFAAAFPEYRTHDGKDLAFVPTVFDQLEPKLINRLVYRGWWLTGASLARWHPGFTHLPTGTAPPAVDP